MHLKYLANNRPKFCELIGLLAKKLLQVKEKDKCLIPRLFQYKLFLWPKSQGENEEIKYRPIIVAESLLKVIHNIYLNELNS